MVRYRYSYQSIESYEKMVLSCNFLLRCTPCDTPFQHVEEPQLQLLSAARVNSAQDCFGNIIHYGLMRDKHDLFAVASNGIVVCSGKYEIEEQVVHPIFKHYTPLTQISTELTKFGREIEELYSKRSAVEIATLFAKAIFGYMYYTPNSTNVSTTATQAFESRCGVCQDYSHILIALCRERGVAARYVVGYVVGTGESHAWVEVWSDGVWYGIDPTHDTVVESGGYIKVSHGRDASDCSIIRGIRRGVTSVTSNIRVIVEQI